MSGPVLSGKRLSGERSILSPAWPGSLAPAGDVALSTTQIDFVHARRVWDSRGRPTVEAQVHLRGGACGRAIAPGGTSVGPFEAWDRRDSQDSSAPQRLGGRDVSQAVAGMRGELSDALIGVEALNQQAVDAVLVATDGSPHRGRLGANALIAVSVATAQAAAAQIGRPLWSLLADPMAGRPIMPRPLVDVFGGGLHAARRSDLQSVGVVPMRNQPVGESLLQAGAVVQAAIDIQAEAGTPGGRTETGALWPTIERNEELLTRTLQAIERAGLRPGEDVGLAVDVAAGTFGRNGRYRLARDGRRVETAGLLQQMTGWCDRYPIVVLEDPFADDDPDGLIELTRRVGRTVRVVADDVTGTDAGRIRRAAGLGACNAAGIRPNQAGTLTDAKAAARACRDSDWATSYGARAGDSEDTAIVHLAVAWQGDLLAMGGLLGGERTAKWNEALRLEEQLARFG